MMMAFELTMPCKASWDGHWSLEKDKHYYVIKRTGKENVKRMHELDEKSFTYRWSDGWEACVSCRIVKAKEAHKMAKESAGFCCYNWMAESIWNYGEILQGKG